jgi:hypothetical protein
LPLSCRSASKLEAEKTRPKSLDLPELFDDSGYVKEVADDAVVYDGEDWLLASDIHSDGHTTFDVTLS